jgi:hypothetical protein
MKAPHGIVTFLIAGKLRKSSETCRSGQERFGREIDTNKFHYALILDNDNFTENSLEVIQGKSLYQN